MSEPKVPKKAPKPQKTESSTNVLDITATLYTSGQVYFLNRTSRLLVNVASGKYMDRALKNGYGVKLCCASERLGGLPSKEGTQRRVSL